MSVGTKMALIILILLSASSVIAIIAVPTYYRPVYFVKAERLSQQPDSYFVLENPDAVVSQAISNTQGEVEISSLEDTQIDEMIDGHNTHYVQVNDSFYQIRIGIADKFPPPLLSLMFLVSPVTLPLSVITITIILVRTMKQKANR